MRYVVLALVALSLTACGDTVKQWSFANLADKVANIAPAYCKIRPQTTLDDLALAGVALATSEQAADTIKSAVDKVCSWVGEPVETKQAAD